MTKGGVSSDGGPNVTGSPHLSRFSLFVIPPFKVYANRELYELVFMQVYTYIFT